MGCSNLIFAQTLAPQQDSVRVIEPRKKNKKQKGSKLNFRSFFNDKSDNPTNVIRAYANLKQKPYDEFQGKIIRKIVVRTLDPFDYSADGESEESINFILRTANKIHIKTNESEIRNFLLFQENEIFDSLLIKESERLIRQQSYTREVAIVVKPIINNLDSIDVFVYELDRWSLLGNYASSSKRTSIVLSERNFMGFGHHSSSTFNQYKIDKDVNFQTQYYIPNLHRTYINASFKFGTDQYKNMVQSLAFERPFFSPVTKWGGGFGLSTVYRNNSKYANDTLYELKRYHLNTQDYWAGYAFKIHRKGHVNEQSLRLIFSMRYLNANYTHKSIETFDSLNIFASEKFTLGTIGLSKRKFICDQFIFDYGVTEDVPIGSLLSFTSGYQFRNLNQRYYAGVKFGYGNFFNWGYLFSNLEYGTFFNQSKTEQGTFAVNISYFTKLYVFGKWKFRQFFKTNTTIGFDRFIYEKLSLSSFYKPAAYNSFTLLGTSKMLFTFQSQFYAPFKFLGFRFAPFFVYSLGMIGQHEKQLLNNQFYSQFGVGVLINNLNLVFNTFQLSIAFYPLMPDNTRNVIGINPFKSTDFGFSNFEIGKPSIVLFN